MSSFHVELYSVNVWLRTHVIYKCLTVFFPEDKIRSISIKQETSRVCSDFCLVLANVLPFLYPKYI